MDTKSNSTPDQVFSYIEHMLIEMRLMSERENAPVLAYLIEMAIIEARDTANAVQKSVTPAGEQVPGAKQLLNS